MAKKKKSEPYTAKVPANVWALKDGHHMALYTGFHKKADAVFPAPTHTEPMEELRVEREALNSFVDAMNAHVHREFQKIVRREAAWWESVERDLGIKRGEATYHYIEQCFRRSKKASEQPPSADAVVERWPVDGRVLDTGGTEESAWGGL